MLACVYDLRGVSARKYIAVLYVKFLSERSQLLCFFDVIKVRLYA